MATKFQAIKSASLAICLIGLSALGGCGDKDRGLTAEQKQSSDRLGEIAKRSAGEWDRLTPDDRAFLVNDLSHGSEQSAKMLLLSASGKVGGKPGGVPRKSP